MNDYDEDSVTHTDSENQEPTIPGSINQFSHDSSSDSSGETVINSLRNTVRPTETQTLSSTVMSESSTRQTMPNIAIIQGFTKLGVAHISTWKTHLQDYLDAFGLGKFTRSSQTAPNDSQALEIFGQQRGQAIIILQTTLDPTNEAHIARISDPYLALEALERRHGVNSSINMANIITEIVNYKYDDSITIAEHVSNIQSLHNLLNQVTAHSSNLRLLNELLAPFAIINLPREECGSLIQQFMGNVENLLTETVFNHLIT